SSPRPANDSRLSGFHLQAPGPGGRIARNAQQRRRAAGDPFGDERVFADREATQANRPRIAGGQLDLRQARAEGQRGRIGAPPPRGPYATLAAVVPESGSGLGFSGHREGGDEGD